MSFDPSTHSTHSRRHLVRGRTWSGCWYNCWLGRRRGSGWVRMGEGGMLNMFDTHLCMDLGRQERYPSKCGSKDPTSFQRKQQIARSQIQTYFE